MKRERGLLQDKALLLINIKPRLFKRCKLGPRPVPAPIRISVATETEKVSFEVEESFGPKKFGFGLSDLFPGRLNLPKTDSMNPCQLVKMFTSGAEFLNSTFFNILLNDFLFQGILPTAKSYNGPWLSCPSGHGMVDRALAF